MGGERGAELETEEERKGEYERYGLKSICLNLGEKIISDFKEMQGKNNGLHSSEL